MTTKPPSILRTFTFVDPECSLKAFGEQRVYPLESEKVKALDPHTATSIFFNSILSFLESSLAKLAENKESREHYKQHPFQKFVMKAELEATLDEKTYHYRCRKIRTFVTDEEFTLTRVASDNIEELALQKGIPMGTPSFTQNVVDMYDLLSDDRIKERVIEGVFDYRGKVSSLKEYIESRFSPTGDQITKSLYKRRLAQATRVELQERLILLEEENQKLKESFKETEESNEALREKIRSQEEIIIQLQTESVMINIQNSIMTPSREGVSYMDDLNTLIT